MKVLILDSGALINLSMNGLLYVLEELKNTGVKLVITSDVKYETVDRPAGIPRFELGALTINNLIINKTLETPEDFGISKEKLNFLPGFMKGQE